MGESVTRGNVQSALGLWHGPVTEWETVSTQILISTEQTCELSGLLLTLKPLRRVSHGSVFYQL